MIKVDASPSGKYLDRAIEAFDVLYGRKGAGCDYTGWIDLPSAVHGPLPSECMRVVDRWRSMGVETVAVIGIGGSYLGAKAAIEALSHTFVRDAGRMHVVFAGFNLSEEYHAELMDYLESSSVAVVVISKSGTTTEPAVAFRIIKEFLEQRYGRKGAAERIVAITDASKGALRAEAENEGYVTFVIPDNVGGRYSVLTPVGLLPVAAAGFDISALLSGAAAAAGQCGTRSADNPAVRYAAARNELYDAGKKVEILVTYNPKMQYFAEWWKQLFGESEGKDGKGLFPASAGFTTDLHSLGQYIQDGGRFIFETVLGASASGRDLVIGGSSDNLDGMGFLAGRHMEYCNRMAALATRIAHQDGGVPNLSVEFDRIDEYCLGELFYFFEAACGISAYMLGVNPFDQPGVEAYKKNMYALLGKPGYEKEGERLRALLHGKV